VTASAPANGLGPLTLRIEAVPTEYRLSFALADAPEEWTSPGSTPTRLLSSEVAHGFTGAFFALYATGNGDPAGTPAAFDWFDYEPRGR
jgi:alpha-N-arabinofuranosidase